MKRNPRLYVLARAPEWIVVAKPPRVITHRNWAHPREYAMLQRVRDLVGERVYPIHRLDRAASGCLLFAIDRSWAGPLQECLRGAQKTYLAFVRGYFNHEGEVQVDKPMKDDNGLLKDASSTVRALGRCHEPRSSLLEVHPRTGRYHQVRRHVRDLHHPIIKDADHGDSKVNRWWKDEYGVDRLGLHAWRMQLTLPDGEALDARCPLFEDQADLFRRLPWWDEAAAARPELAEPALRIKGPPWVRAAPGEEAADNNVNDAILEGEE